MASLQDALSDAFDKHVPEDNNDQSGRQLTTIDNDAGTIDEAPSGELTESTGSVARARGADGKFAKNDDQSDGNEVSPNQEPRQKKAVAPAPSPEPTQQVKAPVSWRPEVRGKFGALPADIQQEVLRREREVEQGLRLAATHRQFTETFQQAMQPYAAMIQAEHGDYITAATSLMNTAYQLRTAPPPQKAALVAQIIAHYGVDITMLDNALSGMIQGQPNQPSPQDPMIQYLEQRLGPVNQLMQRLSQADQEAKQTRTATVQSEIELFAADPKNEYYEDVKYDMADLLELAAKRGQKMTLQEAYSRATIAHPTIGDLVATRKLSQTAQHQNGAARRARNASASLPSGDAPEQGSQGAAKPKDLNSAIAAAWDAVEQRNN